MTAAVPRLPAARARARACSRPVVPADRSAESWSCGSPLTAAGGPLTVNGIYQYGPEGVVGADIQRRVEGEGVRYRITVCMASAATCVGLAAVSAAEAEPAGEDRAGSGAPSGWQLVQSEDFSDQLRPGADTGWFRNSDDSGTAYDVDEYDNDGDYFRAFGGDDFDDNLAGLDLYRRSYTLGQNGWLTAELAARDSAGDGRPDALPRIRRALVRGAGAAGAIEVPSHNSGAILRSTDPLPKEYRAEVTLRGIDFGGKRDDTWHYDDKVNGYAQDGCKTNFPWAGGPAADQSLDECDWLDVTTDANGYYFLSIMDYERPAPRNNVFIHNHRKVVMDGYNRYDYTGDGLRYCDPGSGDLQPYEWGSGNGVNMLFMTPERRYDDQPGTEYLMPSECGTVHGGGIVSQVDLVPEYMPRASYTFAIERREGSYTMEVSGYFRNVGWQTYRYSQPFDDGEHPIYHYNQTAEEYDGRHNADWVYGDGERTYVDEDIWPAGSSYPDYFLMGVPHTNFYEGSATVDDIRLYVPRN